MYSRWLETMKGWKCGLQQNERMVAASSQLLLTQRRILFKNVVKFYCFGEHLYFEHTLSVTMTLKDKFKGESKVAKKGKQNRAEVVGVKGVEISKEYEAKHHSIGNETA